MATTCTCDCFMCVFPWAAVNYNPEAKVAISRMAGIPLVHGSVGGLYGQVAVVRPGDRLLQRLYRGASPTARPTTASAVAAVAAPMAQACCDILRGGGEGASIPSNTLLTIDLHTLSQPCRLVNL